MVNGAKCYLRPVQIEDAELLYQWRNEESVRENSFNSEPVDFHEHQKWLEKVLQQDKVLFFILQDQSEAVGQVRLVINNEERIGIINYSISLEYRCRGYGKSILQLVEQEVSKDIRSPLQMVGLVKYSNFASQHVFQQLGYEREEQDDIIRYTKLAN